MAKVKDEEINILKHIEALRWHLVRSTIAIIFFGVVAFIFKDIIFDDLLLAPKSEDFFTNRMLCKLGNFVGTEVLCFNSNFQIININLAGQLSAHITVSLIIGFLIAFPYIFYEFWRFIRPAINKSEIKTGRSPVFFASTLFTVGALFGYYVITPLSIHFLGTYAASDAIINQINLSSYIQTFTSVILSSAVVFELPVLIYFLSKIGIVSPPFLKRYRKHAFVLILILSAIITPPDVFSQILVSLPLVMLYEVGIMISKRIEKQRL